MKKRVEKKETIWEMAMQNAKSSNKAVEASSKINMGRELLMLLSTEPSLLSTKKIERMIIFLTLFTITVVLILNRLENITTFDFIQIIGIWLGYGGWSSYLTFRDKKLVQETKPDESKTETTPAEIIQDAPTDQDIPNN
jgi:hypothetical protein